MQFQYFSLTFYKGIYTYTDNETNQLFKGDWDKVLL